jgi:tRNA threonylcarbamoyladenosine biosynthesis protein TsaB
MKLLAVDTCAKSCSAAVADGDRILGEVTLRRRETHSRHLMRLVDMVLEIGGVSLADIEAFGVTRGPGSFTGLRIGMSTVKGLALAPDRPVIGISSLSALALPLAWTGSLVCAMLDAGKKEVYSATFRCTDGRLPDDGGMPPESVLRPGDLLAEIAEPCIFVGDGVRAYGSMIESRLGRMAQLPSDAHHDIQAASVAQLALIQMRRGALDAVDGLIPRYLRKSDAELSLGMQKGRTS